MRDYDYMRALYQRFAMEPEDERLQTEIQEAYDLELEVTFRLAEEGQLDTGDLLGFLDGNTGGYLGSYGDTQQVDVTVAREDGAWYILGGEIEPPARDFGR